MQVGLFWPYVGGAALVLAAVAGPILALRRSRRGAPFRAMLAGSLLPAVFLLVCLGLSEGAHALFSIRWSRIAPGWPADRVTALLGPPDHVFDRGTLWRTSVRSNPTPVWAWRRPCKDALLQTTPMPPFVRFRSGVDEIADAFAVSPWGPPDDAFVLQLGAEGEVLRVGGWE